MGRFSLLGRSNGELAPPGQVVWNELDDSDDDDETESDDDRSSDSECAGMVEGEADDVEVEPPHPLGFSPSYGRTRFYLDRPRESVHQVRRRLGYFENDDDDFMEDSWLRVEPVQSYPPLNFYLDSRTAPTSVLLRNAYEKPPGQHHDDIVDSLTQLLQAANVMDDFDASPLMKLQAESRDVGQRLWALSQAANRELQAIRHQVDRDRWRMTQEHLEAAEALKMLLKRDEDAAAEAMKQEGLAKQQLDEADNARRKLEAEEESQRQDAYDKQQQLEQQALEKVKQAKDEELSKREEIRLSGEAKKKAAAEADAKKHEYVAKAKKLVLKLVELRASVEPFETSKTVARRRLNMKKTAVGKVNTLSPDSGKIETVAAEVSHAIQQAREEDDQYKQQMQAGNAQITSEMTRGKRYLIDLVASTAMVRTQAEGFNGPRGDGFPLACMLAMVSTEAKELVPILAAHIYTVCPTAIPTLPKPAPDCSEQELMESLGMLRGKDGEFETFERFLSRTEGIISLVADILTSTPAEHVLLGGHKGAIEWLERFLGLLPPPPAILPLLTATVLDAFLVGAGHMMANIFPQEFKKFLDVIINDTIHRLDEGPIGEPRALRLKKVVQGGFDGFKNTLPHKAIPTHYMGSMESGRVLPATGFPVTKPASMASTNPTTNPFGVDQRESNTPFALTTAGQTMAPNPFGASIQTASGTSVFGRPGGGTAIESPFGRPAHTSMNSTSVQPSPFGTQNQFAMDQIQGESDMADSNPVGTTSSNNPFGSSTPNPFGAPQSSNPFDQAQNKNAFGLPPVHSSPFGRPSGQVNDSLSNTSGTGFGTNSSFNPQPSPFGANPAAVSNPNPFGSSNANPFGASSGFGGGGAVQSSSNQSTLFAGGNSQASSLGGSAVQSSPFGGNQSNSFGGASSTPFGGASTPFGSTSTPFGGTSTPFGGTSTLFGGGASTPFATNQQGGAFSASQSTNKAGKPPCKFFAQGKCRYGENCRFSHESPNGFNPGSGGSSSGFGGNSSFGGRPGNNPFGGPRR